MSLYDKCTSKLTSTEDVNNENKSTKIEKKHFDVDFTCCTSVCSYDDYDW